MNLEAHRTGIGPDAPSLMRFAPGMIAVLIAIACSTNSADTDIAGHLRFGADMIARGAPAHVDTYAYSIRGLAWVSHEWLSEVAMAWMYAKAGVTGLKIIRFVCASGAIICLAGAIAETGASIGIQFVVLLVVTIGLVPEMQFRPQVFTYAMLSAVMWLIARDTFRGRAPLWIAVPMMVPWANLHGGFVTGLAAIGLYAAVTGVVDVLGGRGVGRGIRLGAITIACALATLATPYGFGTWRSVVRTVSRPPMLAEIIEWQPLTRAMVVVWHMSHGAFVFDIVIVAVLATLVLAIIAAPRGGDVALLAVAAMMITAMFQALRNVPLGLIGSAAPLARHLSLGIARFRETGAASMPASARSGPLTQVVLWGLAALLAIKLGIFSRNIETSFTYPVGAVAFMKDHNLHGNVIAHFPWDDYLLFHLSRDSRVFIDSRYEMIYPDRISREFEDWIRLRADAPRVLDAYPHDFVMVPPEAPVLLLMRRRPEWKLIYQDPNVLLFARSPSPAAAISGTPQLELKAPSWTFP